MEKIINNTIPAVKIIIYRKDKGFLKFLLVIEPEGDYGFVGGAQDLGDNTIKQAAVRELFEEVGLSEKSCPLKETSIFENYIHTDKTSPRYGKKGRVSGFLGEFNSLEEIKLEDVLLGYEWIEKEDVVEKLKNSPDYLTKIFLKSLPLVN